MASVPSASPHLIGFSSYQFLNIFHFIFLFCLYDKGKETLSFFSFFKCKGS
jgi:hypothetical protein